MQCGVEASFWIQLRVEISDPGTCSFYRTTCLQTQSPYIGKSLYSCIENGREFCLKVVLLYSLKTCYSVANYQTKTAQSKLQQCRIILSKFSLSEFVH